jgi:hypothetical protein
LPVEPFVEADLWTPLPADLPHLLTLLPRADLSRQDEVQFAFHPTLTRLWSLKGRRGQRLLEAPGDKRKVYGCGLGDWRDGWCDGRIATGRTADHVSVVYTPAYDPDANRIEWLWRISRRIVTHTHQRKDVDSLLADARTHVETLARTPNDLLRHIGSPFAPDRRPTQSQALAA